MSFETDVRDFMKLGHPENIQRMPTIPTSEVLALCKKLIYDEVNKELLPALDAVGSDPSAGHVLEIADGIIDSLYVLIYTGICFGLPLEELWDAVQAANMAKVVNGVVHDPETNKILKPEGWQPPNISRVLNQFIPLPALFCPNCHQRHVDSGEWATRPHVKHLCVDRTVVMAGGDRVVAKGCGHRWSVLPLAYGAP